MAGSRRHLATRLHGVGAGSSFLRCGCGWESNPEEPLTAQRAAHRAHRVEMGETVKPLAPTRDERLKAAEQALSRARAEIYVVVNPRQNFGKPSLARTRVPVWAIIAPYLVGETEENLIAEYGITREDILVACWYQARYEAATVPEPWQDWLYDNEGRMWTNDDWTEIPLPAQKEDH